MEIRILNKEEAKAAVKFSRVVFNNMIRPHLFEATTANYFDEYMDEEQISNQVEEGSLTIWGAFVKDTLVGVSALMSNGHVTMIYMHPCVAHKGYAKELLRTMRIYGRMKYGYEFITVNASPAWTVPFFKKCGFFESQKVNQGYNTQTQAFVPLKAKTIYEVTYQKRHIAPGKVVAWLSGTFILLLAISAGVLLNMYI